MRARVLIAFTLGAVLGGAAVALVTGLRPLEFPHTMAHPETVRILVAKREIAYGTKLAPNDLQWVAWPKAAVPPGSFSSVTALFGEKRNETRVALRGIAPGEPVLESNIIGPGEARPRSFTLREGQRAVAIGVDATFGVAGFVAPGDRVDIMLIRDIEDERISSIILQDVPVIAVDDRRGGTADERRVRMVTVEVGIDEAQKLVLAQQVGRLALTRRGIGGETPAPSRDRVPRRLPGQPKACERPWSGYRDIRENILRPNLCRSSLDGIIGPGPDPGRPVRVRGDFGVPRGLDAPLNPAAPAAPPVDACAPQAGPAASPPASPCRG